MSIKPLEDRVLIKVIKEEKKSEGGILLPGTSSDGNPVKGTVEEVGTGRTTDDGKKIPVEVKKGDTVLLYSHAGTKIKINDVEYVLARESELLAVVD